MDKRIPDNLYKHKRVKLESATWPEFDENGNIMPETKNLHHEEKKAGNLETAEKPEKIYYFEDPDSDRSQHGERGALGERGTFSVFYDPKQRTYVKNGEKLTLEEAKSFLKKHPNLDERDRKRFESL